MEIKKVTDVEFSKYGRVVEGLDTTELIRVLEEHTPCGEDVEYEPSVVVLENLPIKQELEDRIYGGMPVQIGYCNGVNNMLNALEYHLSSEINVGADDFILLVGKREDIAKDGSYDTGLVEAFVVPKGVAVEMYATTLHYAPVNGKGFRVVVVLPEGTNTDFAPDERKETVDKMLFARNKWLVAHPEAEIDGAFNGLTGENIRVEYEL